MNLKKNFYLLFYIFLVCIFLVYGPASCAPDSDGDGITDQKDNCPTIYNPFQTDADADGIGDACDILRSCKEILEMAQINKDGEYTIDPDGDSGPIEPFTVYCDMTNGGWTYITKDQDSVTLATWTGDGKGDRYEKRTFQYSLPITTLKALMDISSEMQLKIIGHCYHVIMWYYTSGNNYDYKAKFYDINGTEITNITVKNDECAKNDSVWRATNFEISLNKLITEGSLRDWGDTNEQGYMNLNSLCFK